MVGVNIIARDAAKLKAVVEKEKLNWRSAVSSDALNAQWNNPGTPSFYVIDHKGIIRHKWLGVPGEEAMDKALAKLIEEVPPAGEKPAK